MTLESLPYKGRWGNWGSKRLSFSAKAIQETDKRWKLKPRSSDSKYSYNTSSVLVEISLNVLSQVVTVHVFSHTKAIWGGEFTPSPAAEALWFLFRERRNTKVSESKGLSDCPAQAWGKRPESPAQCCVVTHQTYPPRLDETALRVLIPLLFWF